MAGKAGWQFYNEGLELAARVATKRADVCKKASEDWKVRYPDDGLGVATERSAQHEAELIARTILALKLKKSPRKRQAG